jgi:beta-lactam-binding protein with PASTA domain
MLTVALLSALITMHFALHGAEVQVPNLTNLTIPEADEIALPKGLQLTLENRFYSLDTPAGRILSQSPPPGSHVRRGWQVRITESLGAQKVEIPNVVGQDERAATVNLRRLTLDLGTIAHIAAPGTPDIVLAQTPPPSAEGVDRPRVSLLLSTPPDASTGDAVVAPILTGLTPAAAAGRAAASGLRLAYAAAPKSPVFPSPLPSSPVPAAPAGRAGATPAPPATPPPASVQGQGSIVIGQYPASGHRILRGDAIHVTLGGSAPGAQ